MEKSAPQENLIAARDANELREQAAKATSPGDRVYLTLLADYIAPLVEAFPDAVEPLDMEETVTLIHALSVGAYSSLLTELSDPKRDVVTQAQIAMHIIEMLRRFSRDVLELCRDGMAADQLNAAAGGTKQ